MTVLKRIVEYKPDRSVGEVHSAMINSFLLANRYTSPNNPKTGLSLKFARFAKAYDVSSFLLAARVAYRAHDIDVFFDLGACRRMLDTKASLKSFLKIPTELKNGIIAAGIDELARGFNFISVDDLHIKNVSSIGGSKAIKDLWSFSLEEDGSTVGEIAFLCPTRSLEFASSELGRYIKSLDLRSACASSEFPVDVKLSLGDVLVSPRSVDGISSDDVFILNREVSANDIDVRIGENCRATGKITGDQLIIQNVIGVDMSENAIDIEHERHAIEVEDLEVRLSFDIGSVSLPLSEVVGLDEGYVFNLPDNYDRQVNITNNSKFVAKGQLVNIDGKLGVQVLEVKYGISR